MLLNFLRALAKDNMNSENKIWGKAVKYRAGQNDNSCSLALSAGNCILKAYWRRGGPQFSAGTLQGRRHPLPVCVSSRATGRPDAQASVGISVGLYPPTHTVATLHCLVTLSDGELGLW